MTKIVKENERLIEKVREIETLTGSVTEIGTQTVTGRLTQNVMEIETLTEIGMEIGMLI